MASGKNSGQTSGDQTTFEEQESSIIEAANENRVYRQYIQTELPKTSPLHIPGNAEIIAQQKNGYQQIKYRWTRGDYQYVSRWHTRTPGAPKGQGDSWVVERHKPGIGAGPNARPAKREILVGKYKWVSKSKWNEAIRARKRGTATKKQKELLDHGHWKA